VLIRNAESTSTLVAGSGLSGGGPLNSGSDVTLDIGAGTGITVGADSISLSASYLGANPTGTVGLSVVNGSATTYMRSDAAPPLDVGITPTWTGIHTFSSQDVHTLGIDLSTSGRVNSQVADVPSAVSLLLKPNVALASGTDRWTHVMQDSAGNTRFSIASNGGISLFSEGATNLGLIYVGGAAATTMSYGIFFSPSFTGSGAAGIAGFANAISGANFLPKDSSGATHVSFIGGYFANESVYAQRAHTAGNFIGGLFTPISGWTTAASGSTAHGTLYGIYCKGVPASKNATATAIYGAYVANMLTGATPATTNSYGVFVEEQTQATSKYGIWLANATAAYKAIAIRDANAWIGSSAAARIDIGATEFLIQSTKIGFFNTAPVVKSSAYTPTNVTTDRAYDANATTLDEVADVLGTLIADLQAYGLIA